MLNTIKIVEPKDNSIMTKVVMTAQEIKGDWKSMDLHRHISLTYKNSISNFEVTETENQVYFIKSKY
jgi:hypothetical protein